MPSGRSLKAPRLLRRCRRAKKGRHLIDADPSRNSCFLIREFYPGEEAVEAKDVGVVVAHRQQRVELILVAEAQVVPGGVQIARANRGVARDLTRYAGFELGDRNDLSR